MSRISPEDVVNNTHTDNFKIPQRPSNRPPVRKISIHGRQRTFGKWIRSEWKWNSITHCNKVALVMCVCVCVCYFGKFVAAKKSTHGKIQHFLKHQGVEDNFLRLRIFVRRSYMIIFDLLKNSKKINIYNSHTLFFLLSYESVQHHKDTRTRFVF